MSTVDKIVKSVSELLAGPAGQRQSARVLAYLKILRAKHDELRAQRRRIRRRKDVAFFATVGNLLKGQVVLDARIHGRSVGTVTLSSKGPRLFKPSTSFATAAGWKTLEWQRAEVAAFLREVTPGLEGHVTEAMVQSAAFVEMAIKSRDGKLRELHNNQPVLMMGLPFQFPSPISASGDLQVAGGESLESGAMAHADVIARRGTGRATSVRIVEIKKPGGDAGGALAQAVAYAAATKELLTRDRSTMLWALGFGESRQFLRFEACAFVHENDRDSVCRAANALQQSNHFCALHAFFYRLDGTKLVSTGTEELGEPQPGQA